MHCDVRLSSTFSDEWHLTGTAYAGANRPHNVLHHANKEAITRKPDTSKLFLGQLKRTAESQVKDIFQIVLHQPLFSGVPAPGSTEMALSCCCTLASHVASTGDHRCACHRKCGAGWGLCSSHHAAPEPAHGLRLAN